MVWTVWRSVVRSLPPARSPADLRQRARDVFRLSRNAAHAAGRRVDDLLRRHGRGAIGFLWYNAHPAEVFMGDVGSLALGGAIGTVAVIIKQELLLPFIGGVFVIEALSVILQVASYKLRKKRIFKMAPIHHHFELMGWSESKIIVRFWIASLIFALFALTTLKLR